MVLGFVHISSSLVCVMLQMNLVSQPCISSDSKLQTATKLSVLPIYLLWKNICYQWWLVWLQTSAQDTICSFQRWWNHSVAKTTLRWIPGFIQILRKLSTETVDQGGWLTQELDKSWYAPWCGLCNSYILCLFCQFDLNLNKFHLHLIKNNWIW